MPRGKKEPVSSRFWRYVDKDQQGRNACWNWIGAQSRDRGIIYDGVRQRMAYHVSWELNAGNKVPHGMMLCHHCDNPKCVRPDHLFLGTQADNNADCRRKGRMKRFLTPEQARYIFSSTDQGASLARQFGVGRTTIRNIRTGKSWREVLGNASERSQSNDPSA